MYRQIPDEIKQRALAMLETLDLDMVSRMLRIRKAALKKLIREREDEQASVEMPSEAPDDTAASAAPAAAGRATISRYSSEYKAAALAMMEEKGAVATIKELGISSYTLYDWKKKAEGDNYPAKQGALKGKARKRYTPEFKAEVIASYKEKGAGETVREFGIVSNTLYNWLDEAGVERVGILSDHADAVAMYLEKGADAAILEYGITKVTLNKWLKDAGVDTALPQKYSSDFREKAVAMTAEMPLTAVAKALGVSASTLATWKTKSRKKQEFDSSHAVNGTCPEE